MSLGSAPFARYELAEVSSGMETHLQDLSGAVAFLSSALALAAGEAPVRSGHLGMLGRVLLVRSSVMGHEADLDEAVRLL